MDVQRILERKWHFPVLMMMKAEGRGFRDVEGRGRARRERERRVDPLLPPEAADAPWMKGSTRVGKHRAPKCVYLTSSIEVFGERKRSSTSRGGARVCRR